MTINLLDQVCNFVTRLKSRPQIIWCINQVGCLVTRLNCRLQIIWCTRSVAWWLNSTAGYKLSDVPGLILGVWTQLQAEIWAGDEKVDIISWRSVSYLAPDRWLKGAVGRSCFEITGINQICWDEELLVSSQYRKAASLFTDMLRRRTFILVIWNDCSFIQVCWVAELESVNLEWRCWPSQVLDRIVLSSLFSELWTVLEDPLTRSEKSWD